MMITCSAFFSIRHPVVVTAVGLMLTALLCLAGCAETMQPTQMSVSKFVRPNHPAEPAPGTEGNADAATSDEDRGKVGVSTGLLFNVIADNGSRDALLVLFPFEGAWTGWLAQRYDLSISMNNFGALGIEGNVALVDNPVIRFGFLHGIQIGAWMDLEEPDTTMLYLGGSGGLMMQTRGNPDASFFFAGKYAFTNMMEADDPGVELAFNHMVFNVGGAFQMGRLQVIPEMILDVGFHLDSDVRNIMILPSISVAAGY